MTGPLIVPVLLAGGAGSRLWPISRDTMPKQFVPLIGARSTYQDTLARVSDRSLFAEPIVITGDALRFFARRQAEDIGISATVVLEPARRESAAAIAAAAMIARDRHPGAVVLALAADHVIQDEDSFRVACVAGRDAAAAGQIVTFGIRPTEPRTSYGYIRPGASLAWDGVRSVAGFVEKPDAATAVRYLADGYLWNSGNFLFDPDTLMGELERFEPKMADAIRESVERACLDLGFYRLDSDAFVRAPAKSIDYAVMEKTDRAAVVDARFSWSDIGSWDSLFAVLQHDADGNALQGPVFSADARNCLVHAEDRLTAVVGTEDLIVISTSDAVLVLPRHRAEDVKQLVAQLRDAKRSEATDHRRIHRPWGYYDSIDRGERFQVKRIVVEPGGTLSLQRHLHRAEHWVVVRGTAEVTIGNGKKLVQENESVYIPMGEVHRLSNPGKIPLEIVEVQTGSYLGEDDIIRLDDVYRRD